jgi:DNA-binding MarR family transcriptional regulator
MGARDGEHIGADPAVLGALVRLSAISTALARRALGRQVHSNLQVATVLSIADSPGLAEQAGVLLPSMSRVLRSLGDAGLVHSVADERDARHRHVLLTDEGRARVTRFRESAAAAYRAPEVAELPALLGVRWAEEAQPFDLAMTRLADEGSAFVTEVRRRLPQLDELASQALWPVVVLYARAAEPRPAALAGFLWASRPKTSEVLNRLESAGLLVRSRPEGGDGRTVEVGLTRAGVHVGDVYREVLGRRSHELGVALARAVAAATTGLLTSGEALAARS